VEQAVDQAQPGPAVPAATQAPVSNTIGPSFGLPPTIRTNTSLPNIPQQQPLAPSTRSIGPTLTFPSYPPSSAQVLPAGTWGFPASILSYLSQTIPQAEIGYVSIAGNATSFQGFAILRKHIVRCGEEWGRKLAGTSDDSRKAELRRELQVITGTINRMTNSSATAGSQITSHPAPATTGHASAQQMVQRANEGNAVAQGSGGGQGGWELRGPTGQGGAFAVNTTQLPHTTSQNQSVVVRANAAASLSTQQQPNPAGNIIQPVPRPSSSAPPLINNTLAAASQTISNDLDGVAFHMQAAWCVPTINQCSES
jgi:hypothetical protein